MSCKPGNGQSLRRMALDDGTVPRHRVPLQESRRICSSAQDRQRHHALKFLVRIFRNKISLLLRYEEDMQMVSGSD